MDSPTLYMGANVMQAADALKCLKDHCPTLNWKPNEKILDVGSGPGDVTKLLFQFIPSQSEIVGVDSSEKMVDCSNRMFQNDKLTFRLLNIEKELPENWRKETFDKIFSFYCLHWVQDQAKAARNMYSMLKEKGQILLLFLSKSPVFEMYESLASNPKWSPYMKDHHKFISPYFKCGDPAKEFARLLEDVGFVNVFAKNQKTSYVYSSKAELVDALIAVNPFLGKVPQSLKKEYIAEMEMYADRIFVTDLYGSGMENVEHSLIVATASK